MRKKRGEKKEKLFKTDWERKQNRFAIRTCLATDLRFERAVPPIYVDLLPLIEALIVYMYTPDLPLVVCH